MPTCDTCGNDYDRAFFVTLPSGQQLCFDSIECAAARIAPACTHCDCRILGHGIDTPQGIYCCANCARHAGESGARDNTAAPAAVA